MTKAFLSTAAVAAALVITTPPQPARAGQVRDAQRAHVVHGKEHDQISDLYYYGARYFDPLSLTWTQADPLFRFAPDLAWDQPRLSGLYTFSLNNPLRYLDPDGQWPWEEHVISGMSAISPSMRLAAPVAVSTAKKMVNNPAGAVLDAALVVTDTVGDIADAGISLARGDRRGAAIAIGAALLPGVPSKVVKAVLGEGADAAKHLGDLPVGGTYKLREPSTGQVRRTGKTNDLSRREKEHARGEETKDLDFEVDRRSDDETARRGREQIIHDEHPEADLNKRQPISPNNPNRDEYLRAGRTLE